MALRQKRQPLELWLVDALPAENVLLLVSGTAPQNQILLEGPKPI
jgi:hypothetical protein